MNAIGPNGISIDTPAETRDKFLNGTAAYPGMYQIYGPDINVGPNAPDGQMIDIGVQFTQDMLEFIQQVFTGFDPDQAVGRVLDQRCAINGVQRKAGTRTITPISVTTTQALTLTGYNDDPVNPFTVSDSTGPLYQLITTYAFGGPATQSLQFQAKDLGATTPTLNSITTIVTITLGVSAVNNPSAATTIGTNEESDYALRIRRAKSVALPSQGFYDGLYGALVDLDGVTSVNLLENITNSTDANGIPGHSIWAIVEGGANADIAQAIYVKRNAGCGMKGLVSVNVTQVDGSVFAVQFDRPTAETLWISMDVHAVTGAVDTAYIKAQLLAQLSYRIGQTSVVSDIVALVQSIAPNAAISNAEVSNDNVTYVSDFLNTTGVNYQFALADARITITEV
jgi:uncharacterized phage protein gp47/JayE